MKNNIFLKDGNTGRNRSFADVQMIFLHHVMSVLLFAASAIVMAGSVFPDFRMHIEGWGMLALEVFIIIAYYDIFVGFFLNKKQVSRMKKIAAGAVMPVVCVAAGAVYYLCNIQVLNTGFFAMENEYMQLWNKAMKMHYNLNNVYASEVASAFSFGIIMMAAVFVLLMILLKKSDIMITLPAAVIIAAMIVDVVPGWTGFVILFAAVVYAKSSEWEDCSRMLVSESADIRKQTGRKKLSERIVSVASLPLIAMVALNMCYGLFESPSEAMLAHNEQLKNFQGNVENYFKGLMCSQEDSGRISNRAPVYQDKQVLKVEVNYRPKGDVYLRGYVGTDYENGEWVCNNDEFVNKYNDAGFANEPTSKLYEKELISGKKANMYSSYYSKSSGTGPALFHYSITDETGLKNGTVYLPYLSSFTQNSSNYSFYADTQITLPDGNKKYTVDNWNGTRSVKEYIDYSQEFNQERIELWYRQFVDARYTQKSSIGSISDYCNTDAIQKNINDGKLSEDRSNVDDDITRKAVKKNEWRVQVAQQVREVLAKQCSYSLNLDNLPGGDDPVEYFLSKSHKGFCNHFASAGVLMLRQLGIPARFASGYIVKSNSFSKTEKNWYEADVPDRSKHAWAEIYLDGLGWIPVEMTPGYQESEKLVPTQMNAQQLDDINKAYNDNKKIQSDAQSDNLDKDSAEDIQPQTQEQNIQNQIHSEDQTEDWTEPQAETQAEPETEPQNELQMEVQGMQSADNTDMDGEYENRKAVGDNTGVNIIILFVIIIIVSAIVATVIRLKRQLKAREENTFRKEIRNRKNRMVVKHIDRRIYRKTLAAHKRLFEKVQRHKITDAEYEKLLAKTYENISQEEWHNYITVLQKTTFSKDDIETEEALMCYKIYRMTNMR